MKPIGVFPNCVNDWPTYRQTSQASYRSDISWFKKKRNPSMKEDSKLKVGSVKTQCEAVCLLKWLAGILSLAEIWVEMLLCNRAICYSIKVGLLYKCQLSTRETPGQSWSDDRPVSPWRHPLLAERIGKPDRLEFWAFEGGGCLGYLGWVWPGDCSDTCVQYNTFISGKLSAKNYFTLDQTSIKKVLLSFSF